MAKPTRKGGTWLIHVMKELGYPSNEEGVCFGYSNMFLQAYYCHDLKKFWDRIDAIYNMSDRQLQRFIRYKSQDNHSWRRIKLSPKEWEMMAFFEGIEIYHQLHKHQELQNKDNPVIRQEILPSSTLVAPAAMDRLTLKHKVSGEEITIVRHEAASLLKDKAWSILKVVDTDITAKVYSSFSGAYDINDLTEYFNKARETVFNQPEHRAGLSLVSGSHAISVIYNADAHQWELIDLNRLPNMVACLDEKELAKQVITAFNHLKPNGTCAIFSTNVYGYQDLKGNDLRTIQKLSEWNSQYIGSNTKKVNNLRDINQFSALQLAAARGHEAVFDQLATSTGSDLNQKNGAGVTPLMLAARTGQTLIVTSLLSAEDINIAEQDATGGTALQYAVRFNHYDVVDHLLKKAAESNIEFINAKNKQGFTVLRSAIQLGHIDIVNRILEERNVDLSASYKGLTPLASAIYSGNLEIVRALLMKAKESKQDIVNIAGKENITPLMLAVAAGNQEIVKELLNTDGINISAKSANKITALDVALTKNQFAIANLILSKLGPTPTLSKSQKEHYKQLKWVDTIKQIIEKPDYNDRHSKGLLLIKDCLNSNATALEKFVNIQKIAKDRLNHRGMKFLESTSRLHLTSKRSRDVLKLYQAIARGTQKGLNEILIDSAKTIPAEKVTVSRRNRM